MSRLLPFTVVVAVSCLACGSTSNAPDGGVPSSPSAEPASSVAPSAPAASAEAAPSAKKDVPCLDPDEADCTAKCDAGDLESCMRLASMFNKVNETKQGKHPEKTRAILEPVCDKLHGPACNYLSAMHANGWGGPVDAARAKVLLAKAIELEQGECDKGNVRACEDIATAYALGSGLPKDKTRAGKLEARTQELRKQGCEAGDAHLCTSFGILGGKPDFIERGCNGGDMFGCEALGNAYAYEDGVPKDLDKARAFRDKACKGGVLDACKPLE